MLAGSLLLSMALALVATSPAQVELPTERVDLIERNSYFDENGAALLDQALFYRWDAHAERYQVVAWRLIKGAANEPRPCDDGYEVVWMEGGKHLRVSAPKYRETWTQYDPEMLERKHLPPDLRAGIFKRQTPKMALPPDGRDPLPPAPPGFPQ